MTTDNQATSTVKQLTVNSPIHLFSEEQIKKALEAIEFGEPFHISIQLIDVMHDLITDSADVDKTVKEMYRALYVSLMFYLNLVKSSVGYED